MWGFTIIDEAVTFLKAYLKARTHELCNQRHEFLGKLRKEHP